MQSTVEVTEKDVAEMREVMSRVRHVEPQDLDAVDTMRSLTKESLAWRVALVKQGAPKVQEKPLLWGVLQGVTIRMWPLTETLQ